MYGKAADVSSLLPSIHSQHRRGNREENPCQLKPDTLLASLGCASLVALRVGGVTDHLSWANALITFGIGACFQHAMQTLLPRKVTIQEQSLIADYAIPLFFIPTFIYGNFTLSSPAKEALFSSIGVFYGGAVAAFAHAYFNRNILEQEAHMPLVAGDVDHPERMNAGLFTGRVNRIAYGLSAFLLGGSITAVSLSIAKVNFATPYGVYLMTHGGSTLASEPIYNATKKIHDQWRRWPDKDPTELPILPKSVARYKKTIEGLLPVAHLLPGMLFSASIPAHRASELLSLSCVGLAGLLTGFARHAEWARFTEVPKANLHELRKEFPVLSGAEKAFSVGKWLFSTGVAAILGLAIAGYDLEKRAFVPIPNAPLVRGSMGTLLATLYGGYFFSKLADRLFQKASPQSRGKNSLYFLTQYSPGIPALNLALTTRLKIGNLAIEQDPTYLAVVTSLAWASLGWAIGGEMARRGRFVHPRAITALSAALIGNFWVWWLMGE